MPKKQKLIKMPYNLHQLKFYQLYYDCKCDDCKCNYVDKLEKKLKLCDASMKFNKETYEISIRVPEENKNTINKIIN
jgi:hypothetical protein